MICNKCGKEFGNESTCQNCGADKVTALGEFRGYSVQDSKGNTSFAPSVPASSSVSPYASMLCWKCGEVIPTESKFCPVCRVQLFVECPKCGHKYSAQYANCNVCGTNREEYLRLQKEREEEELLKRKLEEAKRQAESKRLEEERSTQRGANWVLIIFFGLLIIGAIASSSEWIPILFGN